MINSIVREKGGLFFRTRFISEIYVNYLDSLNKFQLI